MKPTWTRVYGPPFDYAKQEKRFFCGGAATAAEAKALGIPWGISYSASKCPGVIEALQMVEKLVGQMEKCLVAGVEIPKLYPYQKDILSFCYDHTQDDLAPGQIKYSCELPKPFKKRKSKLRIVLDACVADCMQPGHTAIIGAADDKHAQAIFVLLGELLKGKQGFHIQMLSWGGYKLILRNQSEIIVRTNQ